MLDLRKSMLLPIACKLSTRVSSCAAGGGLEGEGERDSGAGGDLGGLCERPAGAPGGDGGRATAQAAGRAAPRAQHHLLGALALLPLGRPGRRRAQRPRTAAV